VTTVLGVPQRSPWIWVFAFAFLAQVAHLGEHIMVKLRGTALIGPAADSEETHLAFNALIAVLALVLMWRYPRNAWVYPLAVLAVFHAIEHVYICEQYLRTHIVNGPGLLGRGSAIGIFPIDRLDLHNIYNGFEVILLLLGFRLELDPLLERQWEAQ